VIELSTVRSSVRTLSLTSGLKESFEMAQSASARRSIMFGFAQSTMVAEILVTCLCGGLCDENRENDGAVKTSRLVKL